MKKNIAYYSTLAALPLFASAATFTDNFDRADVAATTNVSSIGATYTNSTTAPDSFKDWAITNNELVFPEAGFADGGGAILSSNAVSTLTGTGASFSASAIAKADTADRWIGIAFNYQDGRNFYAFRIQADTANYQFLQVIDGVASATALNSSGSTNFELNTFYALSAGYDDATGLYSFTAKNIGSGAILNPITTLERSTLSSPFENGTAGIYSSGINVTATFDDFSVSSIPEPSSAALLLGLSGLLLAVSRRHRA